LYNLRLWHLLHVRYLFARVGVAYAKCLRSVTWVSTPHSAMKQAQIVGSPLQLFAELGRRNADQAASPLSGTAPEQHGPAILGDHIVDVRPRGGHHRPGRQRGHDARDLSINRREFVRHVARSGLGRVGCRGERENRSPVRSVSGTLEKIYLSAHPAILGGADRLGTHLPGQINLQGAIDGHHMVKLTNDLDIVGVADRTQLNHGIIIQKVHEAARPNDKAGDHLASVKGLTGSGNDSPLDEVEYTIGEHFAMYAQVTPISQRLHDGIGNGSDTQLQSRPILNQLRYMPAYLPLHLVGR